MNIPATEAQAPAVETPELAQVNAEPQVGATEALAGEEIPPAEKTFTQAELDAIIEKKSAKLIRQRDQERARREVYEQQLAKATPPQHASDEPQPEQFQDPRQYARAVVEFERQKDAVTRQAQETQRQQSSSLAKRDDFVADLQDIDGFDMAKFGKLRITPDMADVMVDSDVGTKLAQHFLSNPDEASRIADLSPARQAAEIGKLEAKLSAVSTKKPSNAPDPINPVNGKGSSVPTNLYDARLGSNTEAWIEARRAQRAAAAKR
jgi:hypothetical protein